MPSKGVSRWCLNFRGLQEASELESRGVARNWPRVWPRGVGWHLLWDLLIFLSRLLRSAGITACATIQGMKGVLKARFLQAHLGTFVSQTRAKPSLGALPFLLEQSDSNYFISILKG